LRCLVDQLPSLFDIEFGQARDDAKDADSTRACINDHDVDKIIMGLFRYQ
jgi:hypothetical protein